MLLSLCAYSNAANEEIASINTDDENMISSMRQGNPTTDLHVVDDVLDDILDEFSLIDIESVSKDIQETEGTSEALVNVEDITMLASQGSTMSPSSRKLFWPAGLLQ